MPGNPLTQLFSFMVLTTVVGAVLSYTVNTWFGLIAYIGVALVWPLGWLLLRRANRQLHDDGTKRE